VASYNDNDMATTNGSAQFSSLLANISFIISLSAIPTVLSKIPISPKTIAPQVFFYFGKFFSQFFTRFPF
jgi:hypothetical protein